MHARTYARSLSLTHTHTHTHTPFAGSDGEDEVQSLLIQQLQRFVLVLYVYCNVVRLVAIFNTVRTLQQLLRPLKIDFELREEVQGYSLGVWGFSLGL